MTKPVICVALRPFNMLSAAHIKGRHPPPTCVTLSGLDWLFPGLDWNGLDWTGPDQTGLDWLCTLDGNLLTALRAVSRYVERILQGALA